jgi:putative ABC transport system permease protein
MIMTILPGKYEDELEYKSSIFRLWSGLINYGKESGAFRIEGVYPDYQFLENASMVLPADTLI